MPSNTAGACSALVDCTAATVFSFLGPSIRENHRLSGAESSSNGKPQDLADLTVKV